MVDHSYYIRKIDKLRSELEESFDRFRMAHKEHNDSTEPVRIKYFETQCRLLELRYNVDVNANKASRTRSSSKDKVEGE